MITLYLTALIAGGLLLTLSLLGTTDDDDAEVDAGDDADGGELEVELDEADAGPTGHALTGAALAMAAFPLRSLRFWTFFLAFGGLAGVLLTWLGPLGAGATAAVAAAVGYATGAGATALMTWTARGQVSSTLGADACVGATGTVLLPVALGRRGRVRIALEDQMVDFDAETEDEALGPSDPVVVYAIRDDGVALVTTTRLSPAPKGTNP